MKKVIKPFWSYNISKIETWLSQMAKKGYILKDVNTLTRVFIFEKMEPKNLTYKICYESKGIYDISLSLKREGWESVVKKNRWVFISNEKESDKILLNPMRYKLIKRNGIIKNITQFIMVLYSVIFLPIFFMLTTLGTLLGGDAFEILEPEIQNGPIIFYLFSYKLHSIMFMFFLFGIYTLVKLNKVSKYIKNDDNINNVEVEDENILLIPDDKLIKKRRVNWFYYPEKTTNWLKDMESKGYNLCKIDTYGNKFYFKKGEPRNIKYIIDYQREANNSYYEIHKEDGWSLRFKSEEGSNNWCLWSKEYITVEPEMYTDYEDKMIYAKNLLISHSVKFIPIILIDTLLVYSNITKEDKSYFMALLFAIIGIRYSKFYISIVKSYLNTKKKVESN